MAALTLTVTPCPIIAATDDYSANLARMPRPWTNRVHHLTEPEYEATLKYWAAKHTNLLKLQSAGVTKQGKPIHTLAITDPGFDDADKQICLVTALHGGPERTGTTTSMHAIEWLLGDDPLARETRRKQIVVFIAALKNQPAFNANAIEAFIEAGPEIKIAIDKAFSREVNSGPIQKGIGFRLRLPYANPELLDVRLNGHLLSKSETDGFHVWQGNGFTQLQINVPPKKSIARTLFVVRVAYKPDVQRNYGWKPPADVLRKLEAGK